MLHKNSDDCDCNDKLKYDCPRRVATLTETPADIKNPCGKLRIVIVPVEDVVTCSCISCIALFTKMLTDNRNISFACDVTTEQTS